MPVLNAADARLSAGQPCGGPLDPREIILSLKKRMMEGYTKTEEVLVPDVVSKESLLACTTCGACVEQCPSRIEIVNTIQQMRRSLALEEGQFAEGVAKTLQNIQSVGNPWGLDRMPAGLGWKV